MIYFFLFLEKKLGVEPRACFHEIPDTFVSRNFYRLKGKLGSASQRANEPTSRRPGPIGAVHCTPPSQGAPCAGGEKNRHGITGNKPHRWFLIFREIGKGSVDDIAALIFVVDDGRYVRVRARPWNYDLQDEQAVGYSASEQYRGFD